MSHDVLEKTQELEREIRKRRTKNLILVSAVIGGMAGLGACWAVIVNAVEISKTPARLTVLESRLPDKLDERMKADEAKTQAVREMVLENQASTEATLKDLKESLARIEHALRIAPPKVKEETPP